MEQIYTIVLKSPMGPKKGSMNIKNTDSCIEGELDCLGKKHVFNGKISKSGKLILKGLLKTPLGEEPFSIVGTLNENILTASLKRRDESYEMLGLKIQ